jgi:nucleolar GTP-binding protein
VILELIEVQKALRKIPIVQLGTPTVVLVGAPNVGKSSIVRAISSGTPEVNNYPFTTRGMALGHIEYGDWDDKCQVMDTPGVLNRPDGERNEMEALTLASMQHLPTAVMFVLDLTGHSGALSSIENQIQIRNDLRARFPKRPWVDVVSKADLPQDPNDPAVQLAPPGALRVSTTDGTGVPQLEARVREMLAEVRDVLALFQLRPHDD